MEKHPGGRPLKFGSPEELQARIDQYFSSCKGKLAIDSDGTGYDPGTGKQIVRSFSGKTQKEVRAKIQQAAVELANGTYQEPSRLTVGAWLDEWMESFVKPTVKPLTVSSYAAAIKNHITPSMGSVKMQALRGTHVQKLYNTMRESGLSAKTIKNVSAILHKAFSVAVKQGLMATNPCDAADVPKGKAREIVPLTDAQIPLFLEAIQGDPYCNAFALCLLAGLREGECLGLSWEQVDFDNGRITISQQLQKEKRKGGQYYIADSTKSGKPRVIEPPPIAFQYLRAEKKKQLENRLHMGEFWDNPFDLVFTEESGRNIIFQTFHKHFKKIAASIGCPDARPHDLRHPYVKHTTKKFSCKSRNPKPSNILRWSGIPAFSITEGADSQSNRSWTLYAISMRLSGNT